ncbi:major facilitator superfamily domain-containing protein [Pilaira anomala]|nr:major facilitator superfamily domain-containing protein [Pilaira anomala]
MQCLYSTINLSFVGTIALVCITIVQSCVSRFGIRILLIAGTIFVGLVGLILAGFSTEIWHLYLTQGVMFGFGASCVYVAAMGVCIIIASGSGIGGLIIPFIMTSINANLGPGWTYRILGFICLFFDILACFFFCERNPPAVRQRKKLSPIINFAVFKNSDFVLFSIASNIGLLGYFIPYLFLPSYRSTLVAASSACNFVGRLMTGYLVDRIGKVNTNVLFTFITAVSCLLIWTFAFAYGSLMAFADGSFFALISPICAALLGMESFLSGLSLLLFTNVFAVFGPNIY